MNDDQGDGNTSDELGDFDVGGIWSEGEECADGPLPHPLQNGGLDSQSMVQLGLQREDVPADGNCLLHAFMKAQRTTSHATKAQRVVDAREQLAKYVEKHVDDFIKARNKTGQWPWVRDNWNGEKALQLGTKKFTTWCQSCSPLT